MESIERRTFLGLLSLSGVAQFASAHTAARPVYVEHGADRFTHPYTIAGANEVAFKVVAQDTHNGLFIIEQVSHRKGGPPRHLHHAQEEWFYIMDGEYVFEVAEQRLRMGPGDSLIGPRGRAACVGLCRRKAWKDRNWLRTRRADGEILRRSRQASRFRCRPEAVSRVRYGHRRPALTIDVTSPVSRSRYSRCSMSARLEQFPRFASHP